MTGIPSFPNLQNLTFIDTPDEFPTDNQFEYPDFPLSHTQGDSEHDFIGYRNSRVSIRLRESCVVISVVPNNSSLLRPAY